MQMLKSQKPRGSGSQPMSAKAPAKQVDQTANLTSGNTQSLFQIVFFLASHLHQNVYEISTEN